MLELAAHGGHGRSTLPQARDLRRLPAARNGVRAQGASGRRRRDASVAGLALHLGPRRRPPGRRRLRRESESRWPPTASSAPGLRIEATDGQRRVTHAAQEFGAEAEVGIKFSRRRNSSETFGVASSRERSTKVEISDSLEHDEGWENVKGLIDLAKRAQMTPLSPQRRQRVIDGLMKRLERDRIERAERQRM